MSEDTKLVEYVSKAQTVYDQGIKVLQDMTGWNKISSPAPEIDCFTRPNETIGFDSFKADCYFDRSPEVLSRYVYNNWNKLNLELVPEEIESYNLVQQVTDEIKVWHLVTPPKPLISKRDFVLTNIFLELGNDTFAIVDNSIETDIPVAESAVRGDIMIELMLFEPAAGDSSRCHLQAVMCIDPAGSIPVAIVNSVLSNCAVYFAKLRERVHSET